MTIRIVETIFKIDLGDISWLCIINIIYVESKVSVISEKTPKRCDRTFVECVWALILPMDNILRNKTS